MELLEGTYTVPAVGPAQFSVLKSEDAKCLKTWTAAIVLTICCACVDNRFVAEARNVPFAARLGAYVKSTGFQASSCRCLCLVAVQVPLCKSLALLAVVALREKENAAGSFFYGSAFCRCLARASWLRNPSGESSASKG